MSLVIIPLSSAELVTKVRCLRKGLRDVRDRTARIDPAWAAVQMAGTVADDHLMLLMQHRGIDRETVWTVLERRWPQVLISAVGTVEPRSELSAERVVQLAMQRRGIEPVRVVIPAQRCVGAHDDAWGEPMPVLV